MNNEITEERAQLYALGTLPEHEQAAFEQELLADRELQSLVHGYQELMESDARMKTSEGPSFAIFPEIMQRIEAESLGTAVAAQDTDRVSPKKSRVVSALNWGGWVAAAACVSVLLAYVTTGRGPAQARAESDIVLTDLASPRFVADATPEEPFTREDRMLELAGLAEAYWFAREGVPEGQVLPGAKGKDLELAEVTGGFTLFDRKFNIGFIAVENLPRESSEVSYHVWARDGGDKQPFRAGTLPIGEDSRGLFFFDLSDLPDGASAANLSFFVTKEKENTPSSPSEVVVLSDF